MDVGFVRVWGRGRDDAEVERGGSSVPRGSPGGSPASIQRTNARGGLIGTTGAEASRSRGCHGAGQNGRGAMSGHAIPRVRAFVGRGPRGRVPRGGLPANRLWGGRSRRRTLWKARAELSFLGKVTPMVPAPVPRSGRVGCGGRCARYRAPRGDGGSEGRRGGGVRRRSPGHARECEHRR